MVDHDDIPSNPRINSGTQTISDLIEVRLSRRTVLGGMFSAAGMLMTGCATAAKSTSETFAFNEIDRSSDATHHVPEGYDTNIVIRWGDHLFDKNAAAFNPYQQTEASQLQRFGYNNDYVGFVTLDDDPTRGLLCVNHEFTSTPLMFPNISDGFPNTITAEITQVEKAAHGGSVVELAFKNGEWKPVIGSKYNRRITAHKTPMKLTGPAAGDDRLKTSADPTGTVVAGTMNNCAGGITPWGTWLMAEENFNFYFFGKLEDGHPETTNQKRYGMPWARYAWGAFDPRYNLEKEPNEPNRFGWVVEVDPFDPDSMPKKRTALGRFKHEGAESVLAPNGRVVVYMGDDQRFDYVYKFVSKNAYKKGGNNADLLDEGTLYVAKFGDDGYVDWLPLQHGDGPLTAENGFRSQADVLIETRRAADLLEATPMDRPEDVQPDEGTGRAWIMLTNNSQRKADQEDSANPRANNTTGHIIEVVEPGGDFTATRSRWEILVQCGDPSDPSAQASWNPNTTENGWYGSPDNGAIDHLGRLWVATDGNEKTGAADGVWAMETDGSGRGTGKAFLRAPVGAEVCGPRFTTDGKTLFVAIQHPGDGKGATFEKPTTRWPDFKANMPPRPSVVAIRQINGRPIGTG